jgi:hypothetical protein
MFVARNVIAWSASSNDGAHPRSKVTKHFLLTSSDPKLQEGASAGRIVASYPVGNRRPARYVPGQSYLDHVIRNHICVDRAEVRIQFPICPDVPARAIVNDEYVAFLEIPNSPVRKSSIFVEQHTLQ